MRRNLSLLFTTVIFSIICSCTPIVGNSTEKITILTSESISSTRIQREIRDSASKKTLRFYSLSRKSASLFELEIERFETTPGSHSFNFSDRYYIEFSVREENIKILGTVSGIKNQPNDHYKRSTDQGFSLLIQNLGFSSFEIVLDSETDLMKLLLPSGEELKLFREMAFRLSSEEEIEHEGKLRKGTYREYVFFCPMNEEFRLYYYWSFNYRNESGSGVTLSGSFDIYGPRTYQSSDNRYLCKVESFSNRAYPRIFYDKNNYEILFDRQISSLGFSEFYESADNGKERALTGTANGQNFSWSVKPTPLE